MATKTKTKAKAKTKPVQEVETASAAEPPHVFECQIQLSALLLVKAGSREEVEALLSKLDGDSIAEHADAVSVGSAWMILDSVTGDYSILAPDEDFEPHFPDDDGAEGGGALVPADD